MIPIHATATANPRQLRWVVPPTDCRLRAPFAVPPVVSVLCWTAE